VEIPFPRVIISYKPEAHAKLIAYLDKEVSDSAKYMQVGVGQKMRLGQPIDVFGKRIDLTKDLRDKVDSMGMQSFRYEIIKIGEIRITFTSMVDSIHSFVRKPMEKVMEMKTRSELKKALGQDFVNVKKEG
jgi:hypothetical protein